VNLANRARGRFGEDLATRWYVERGYRIIDRNWRTRGGELDLVAERAELIVVCEVKARASLAYGHPFEAITAAKLARLRRLAVQWLHEHDRQGMPLRLDIAGIIGVRIEVLEGVGA
jgi:putative endonuclease